MPTSWSAEVIPHYHNSNCSAGLAELEESLENGNVFTEFLGGRWKFEIEMVRLDPGL